ncbi:MAG: Lrp/AsnC ligand binding domain-containing protein [Nitrososphaera sp.]|jgi:DNA-binding Lrp family transcriptional regulator
MIYGFVLATRYPDRDRASIESVLANIAGVKEVYRTSGIYDMVIKIEAADAASLRRAAREIKAIDGIQFAVTNVVYDAEYGIRPPTRSATAA